MLLWLDQLQDLESDILYNQPTRNGDVPFRHEMGNRPVLISAPHATAHLRTGLHKNEDEYTAAFARLAGKLSGAHVLYTSRRLSCDPNYDEHCDFKDKLAGLVEQHSIHFVLDLHGARPTHPFGVALGTMKGESCPLQQPAILHAMEEEGFCQDSAGLHRLALNILNFSARRQHTITRFCSTILHVPAAQMELNAHLRIVKRKIEHSSQKEPFQGDPHMIQCALQAILHVVETLNF